jgi:hypothetical protein
MSISSADLKKWRKYRLWGKQVDRKIDVGLTFNEEEEKSALAVHIVKGDSHYPHLLGNVVSDHEHGFEKEELQRKIKDLLDGIKEEELVRDVENLFD